MNPRRYDVGDKVVITKSSLAMMESSNRSCVTPGYPSDTFLKKVRQLVGVEGVVTHAFPTDYSVSVRFGDQSFHMRGHWVEPFVGKSKTLYKVTWEIDIEADSPREAAATARKWLLDPGAECVIFEVKEHDSQGAPTLIDLLEDEDEQNS